ncbi:MAG: PH domain-containing protein [Candidatus Brocadiia bacterium]
MDKLQVSHFSSLHIFIKNLQFVFLIGVLLGLKSQFDAQANNVIEKPDWEIIKNHVYKQNILGKDEDVKYVVRCGLFGTGNLMRFNVLTNERFLGYKKYFGVTDEIKFQNVKKYNYKITFLVMTLKFETDNDTQIFEIITRKSLQSETITVLDKLMAEKNIPRMISFARE